MNDKYNIKNRKKLKNQKGSGNMNENKTNIN